MDETKLLISICSPAHNEERNVGDLIGRISSTLDVTYSGQWEIVVVNDGSTDGTGLQLEQLAALHPQLRTITHPQNLGEPAAWQTAFEAARGNVIVLLAADLQSPPEEIPQLVSIVLDEHFDVGTGRRNRRLDDRFYLISTRILTAFTRVVFGMRVKDVSSSFFAVRRELLQGLTLYENDHRYILPIFWYRGATIKEIPVTHAPRRQGHSHYRKSKVLRAIPEVIRFTYRYFRGTYALPSQRQTDTKTAHEN